MYSDCPQTLGEYIAGTSGTLWAFGGISLFAAALFLQTDELSLQRQMLQQSLEANETTASAMEKQTAQQVIRAEIDVKIARRAAVIAKVDIGGGRGGAAKQAEIYEKELESLIQDLKGESSK